MSNQFRFILFTFTYYLVISFGIVPASANITKYSPITPSNISNLTEIAQLGNGWVHGTALSEDGSLLAVGTTQSIFIHNLADNSVPVIEISYHNPSYSTEIQFSLNNQYLLVNVDYERNTLWDITTQEIIEDIDLNTINAYLYVTERGILRRDWNYETETLTITNIETEASLFDEKMSPASYSLSPSGLFLLAENRSEGHIEVIEINSGDQIYEREIPPFSNAKITWSPDAKSLLITVDDMVIVWDSDTLTEWQIVIDNYRNNRAIWTSDSQHVVMNTTIQTTSWSNSRQTYIGVHSADNGQLINQFDNKILGISLYDVVQHNDEEIIVTGTTEDYRTQYLGTLNIFDNTFTPIDYPSFTRAMIGFYPIQVASNHMVWKGDDNRVRVFDLNTMTPIQELRYSGHAHALAFHPDSSVLAAGSETPIYGNESGSDNNIRIWNMNDFTEIADLDGHSARVRGLDYSDDGQYLISFTDWYDEPILWETNDYSPTIPIPILGEQGVYYRDGAFLPNSSNILGHPAYDAFVNYTPDLTVSTETSVPTGLIARTFAMSNDGRLIALTSGASVSIVDYEVRTQSGQADVEDDIASIYQFQEQEVQHLIDLNAGGVAFSSDDNYLAIAHEGSYDNEIYPQGGHIDLWQVEPLQQIATWQIHEESTYYTNRPLVIFSPDDSLMIAAGANQIYIMDIETQTTLHTIELNEGFAAHSLAISPDGRLLALSTSDGVIHIFGIPA